MKLIPQRVLTPMKTNPTQRLGEWLLSEWNTAFDRERDVVSNPGSTSIERLAERFYNPGSELIEIMGELDWKFKPGVVVFRGDFDFDEGGAFIPAADQQQGYEKSPLVDKCPPFVTDKVCPQCGGSGSRDKLDGTPIACGPKCPTCHGKGVV